MEIVVVVVADVVVVGLILKAPHVRRNRKGFHGIQTVESL